MRAPRLLEMRGIVKHYGAVRANDGVDLDVAPGQIVGLLGENGSGKSTLMKVLFGMVTPDGGGIVFNGRELSGHRPRDAMAAGIEMVHQHFMLVEAMSVADNVMLGWAPAGRWLRSKAVHALIRDAAARYGLDLLPEARIGALSFGQRQRVEILKAILRGAKLLVLDEPTSNLSPPEIEGLIAVMRRLRAEGCGVVFISHKLAEVMTACDDAVVLRDGKVVGRVPIAATTRTGLAQLMVGREVAAPLRRSEKAPAEVLLSVEDLGVTDAGGRSLLGGVSFTVAAGEVLAVAGVDGNGQIELVETIAGIRRAQRGSIRLNGKDLTHAGVAARVSAGMAFVPPDRAGTSLVADMTISENLALRDVRRPPFSRGPFLNGGAMAAAGRHAIAQYAIRASSAQARAGTLSGGNQQKIVVAREIGRQPKVLVAFQATWGLDPGATRFVLDQVLALRAAGAAVLYVSTELEELLAVGDRIGVMFNGGLVEIVARDAVDLDRLGMLMAGAAAGAPQRAA